MTAVIDPERPASVPLPLDWALVERAKTGDSAAFGELYRTHKHPIWLFVRTRIYDSWTADDLTAEVFARAFRALPNVRFTGQPYIAWLTTVARNLVNDHYKAARLRYEMPTGGLFDSDEYDSAAEPTDEPEAVAERADLAAAVRRAVAQLPPRQRDVIERRFLEDRSVAESAELTGSHPHALKAMQFRAIQRLRRDAADLEVWLG